MTLIKEKLNGKKQERIEIPVTIFEGLTKLNLTVASGEIKSKGASRAEVFIGANGVILIDYKGKLKGRHVLKQIKVSIHDICTEIIKSIEKKGGKK